VNLGDSDCLKRVAVASGASLAQHPPMAALDSLLTKVRACTLCKAHLPLGPRPVLQLTAQSRILIAGQAPGRKVHASGVPFDDASGERLRNWLGVSREQFYDARQIAILPMGFCYPGTGKSGDLPPRPECAEAWRAPLLRHLKHVGLTVVLGQYAQDYHFGAEAESLTDLVKAWREHWPTLVPLPHPSPRNNLWLKRNPWFQRELLPELRKRVATVLSI
jgi:uracil-DNA glycosylase